jgi:ADP-ribose pyrophosphatase YjhB (NUDIX family)
MPPIQHFRHCPACAAAVTPGPNPLVCAACGFCFFFNPTVSAAAFVFDATGRTLLLRRAKEPAKGLFGIPGGFIDIGEAAEEALHREVMEEVGIEVMDVKYLCSCPNLYPYRGVTYPVCDLVFTAKAVRPEAVQSLDDVAGYEWKGLGDVKEEELAFPSLKLGLQLLRSPRA